MKINFIMLLTIFSCIQVIGQNFYSDNPLVATYSIVARDPETGEMGVAVQSHWFSVGSIVSWEKLELELLQHNLLLICFRSGWTRIIKIWNDSF